MTNREYWVNVEYSNRLGCYYSKSVADYWVKAPWARAKYRLHIKLKDRPGLTHNYPLKMQNNMVTLNVLPKYEELV